ncbi:YcgL domain-containing protein [Rheinheimera gaetbuli]
MLCAVYKSVKKDGAYLYVQKRDDFSAVPAALLQSFGTPQLVTLINLAGREHLANADINKVKQQLAEQGFYLQIPPPVEDLLAQHKRRQ